MSFIWKLNNQRQGRNPWLKLNIYYNSALSTRVSKAKSKLLANKWQKRKTKHHRISSEFNINIKINTNVRFQLNTKGVSRVFPTVSECRLEKGHSSSQENANLLMEAWWEGWITPGNSHRHEWLLQKPLRGARQPSMWTVSEEEPMNRVKNPSQ